MAVSVINIINRALLIAGCDTITSLTQENSRNARVANTIYESTRRELLRGHPWNFATLRTSLAQLSSTPTFGFNYEYQLPSNCLRVIRAQNPNSVYKVEGRKLLTDENTFSIAYIADIEDTTLMDDLFRLALVYELAAQFAAMIRLDQDAAAALASRAEMMLRKARQIDGQEDTAELLVSNLWTDGENGPI